MPPIYTFAEEDDYPPEKIQEALAMWADHLIQCIRADRAAAAKRAEQPGKLLGPPFPTEQTPVPIIADQSASRRK